jgi:hypothetical protein
MVENSDIFDKKSWKDCHERCIGYWSWWWNAWIVCDHHACMSMNLTWDLTKPRSFTSTGRMRWCSEHIGYLIRKETLLHNTFSIMWVMSQTYVL